MSIPNAASVDVNIGAFCHLAWAESLSHYNYLNATTASLGDSPGDALPTVLHEKPTLNLSFPCFWVCSITKNHGNWMLLVHLLGSSVASFNADGSFSPGGSMCAQWHSGSNARVLCEVENGTEFSEINGRMVYFMSFTTSSFTHLKWQVNSHGNWIEWKHCTLLHSRFSC